MLLQNELNILDLLTCVLLISFSTMRTTFPMFLDVTNFMANHSSYRLPPDLQIWGRENPEDVHHHFLLYVGSGGLRGGRSTGQNHELSTGRVLVKENGADILGEDHELEDVASVEGLVDAGGESYVMVDVPLAAQVKTESILKFGNSQKVLEIK